MTPKEAAAKCREMQMQQVRDRRNLASSDPIYHYFDGQEVAYANAAALIDQINQPQPWPPPENVNHVLAWPAATSNKRRWVDLEKHPDAKWYVDATVFSLWLPMPPAPEVKG